METPPILTQNIPDTRVDSLSAREAFSQILLKLFADYPTDNAEYQRFRKHAIWALGAPEEGEEERQRDTGYMTRRPREAAWMACGTGAPDEEILGAYAMLFT